tara:strand:+ start:491 stop:748 length:258 start_codon:yes stop_codon:yes gene_type:complete
MFGFITGKIKTAIILVLSIAIPVIYIFGRMGGGSKVKQAVLEEEAEKAKRRANFYKDMAKHEQEIESGRSRNADDLVSKLRSDGL